jgi:hypothetical protein
MNTAIGTKVRTIHGSGKIIGYDLPESKRAKRYLVKLDKWEEEFTLMRDVWGANKPLAYFESEIRESE